MHILPRRLILSIVVLLVVVLLAIFFWQALTIRKQSEYHEYHYGVSISTPSPLGNCTLHLPVPSVGNRSVLGDAMVRGEGYSVSPDWMLSLGQVNGTPMLRIFAPAIVPEYHGYPIPIEPGRTPVETPPPAATAYSDVTPVLIPVDFGVSLKVQEPIDTRNPFDRELLLANPESVTPVPCRGPSDSGQCYRFPAPVSVSCTSGGDGNLTMIISAGGTNQWWMGGWSGNSYDETIEVTFGEDHAGWVVAEGFLSTGEGRY